MQTTSTLQVAPVHQMDFEATSSKGYPMFKRISHVCANSSDLPRTLDFHALLGLTPVVAFTRKGKQIGAFLRISDSDFVEVFEKSSVVTTPPLGIHHFCLEVDDLDAVIADLRSKGLAIEEKHRGCDGTWQTWLQDPDGNRIELHQYTNTSLQLTGGTMEVDW
jgi:lactoylglutathione lyase/glyoxylase I family protein